jgi:hypothetical protein
MLEVWVTARWPTEDDARDDARDDAEDDAEDDGEVAEGEGEEEGEEEHFLVAACADVSMPSVLIVVTTPRRSNNRTAGPRRELRAVSTNVVPATRQAIARSRSRTTSAPRPVLGSGSQITMPPPAPVRGRLLGRRGLG